MAKRRFGSVRKLPSGRYQVRYLGPDGAMRPADRTFARKTEAERWLSLTEAEMTRGDWTDPKAAQITVSKYARTWIDQRPGLRPRTIELYDLLLRLHVAPYIGGVQLGKLTPSVIRAWRVQLIESGSSASMAAKAYRFLRAVMNTAVKEDELIRNNPCRIPGADKEHTDERPVLTINQVFTLADSVPPRFRALILLSTFASLRWGEAIALQWTDVDLNACTVRVTKAYSELTGSKMVIGPTKSRAGVRTVRFPGFVKRSLEAHQVKYPAGQDGLIFSAVNGSPLRRSNFRTTSRWRTHATELGVPTLRFHDLRHTGNTLAAQTGSSLRDLMTRMGHDSPRAALLYQHASASADQAIADALDERIKEEQAKQQPSRSQGPAEAAETEDQGDDDAAPGVPD